MWGGAVVMVAKDLSSSKQRPGTPSVALKHLKEFSDIDLKLTRNLVRIHFQIAGLTVVIVCRCQ